MVNQLKCIAISDIHGDFGNLCAYVNPHVDLDILFIAGDIFENAVVTNVMFNDFAKYVLAQNPKHVIATPGNHDFYIQNTPKEEVIARFKNELAHVGYKGSFHLLIHETLSLTMGDRAIQIFGTPYCKQFYNWAYMMGDDKLRETFQDIPEGLDVLLTHDVPYGARTSYILDKTSTYYSNESIGSKPLDEVITRCYPKIHIGGHIHSGAQFDRDTYKDTLCVNASVNSENYELETKGDRCYGIGIFLI